MTPTLLDCPRCGNFVSEYVTLNDRLPVCAPCAEILRAELVTLTLRRWARGAAAGLAAALMICVVVNVLLANLDESSGLRWAQGIAAVFLGTVVGRTARRWAQAGGLWLQLTCVAIALFAVSELMAGDIYAESIKQGSGPVVALITGVVFSPIAIAWAIPQDPILLFWIFWAVYDPWRSTRALAVVVRGPFPVAGAAPAPAPPAAPPATDAKAAGMDFERPQ